MLNALLNWNISSDFSDTMLTNVSPPSYEEVVNGSNNESANESYSIKQHESAQILNWQKNLHRCKNILGRICAFKTSVSS